MYNCKVFGLEDNNNNWTDVWDKLNTWATSERNETAYFEIKNIVTERYDEKWTLNPETSEILHSFKEQLVVYYVYIRP